MKVFLSRNHPSESLFNHAQKSAWELTCFSCIRKSLITREGPPEADWIFFYSPSAVRLYAKNFERSTHLLAALGEGTAQAMREHDLAPDFVGSATDPSEVVREFSDLLNANQSIVQGRGEKSFERLREVLNAEQIIDWPFYKSEPAKSIPFVEADYYIFTSPSNVEAYLAKHSLPENAVAVVFGESTKAALREESGVKILVTDEPGEESAIQKIDSDRVQ